MSLEAAIFDFVSSDAGLTAILGAGPDCRCFPRRLPQETSRPALVYSIVSDAPSYTHDQAGDPPSAPSYNRTRVQFDLWGVDYEDLTALRDALFQGISGFRGTMGTVDIQSVFIAGQVDGFEPDTTSNRKIIDAMFSWAA